MLKKIVGILHFYSTLYCKVAWKTIFLHPETGITWIPTTQKSLKTKIINPPKKRTSTKMDIENVKSQMRKGLMEYCIMQLLHGGELYATDILSLLKAANMLVVEGTLYPILSRLRREGLLTHRWQESKMGPPRKYFVLTSEGEAALSELDEAWRQLSASVAKVKRTASERIENNM